MELISLWHSWV